MAARVVRRRHRISGAVQPHTSPGNVSPPLSFPPTFP
jgi:hypothetical protein